MKPNYIIAILLLGAVFLQGNVTYAQLSKSLPFYKITELDGLSSNYVTSLTKDKTGFLWIATNNGLCRYDGPNSIKVFKVDTLNNKEGLASNTIHKIFSDSKNNLWIGTRLGGLTRYHLPSNTWKTFQHNKEEERSISHNDILTIYEDSQNRIWVGTESGLNLYHPETENFTRFLVEDDNPYSLKKEAILSIMEDDKGWIWVGTWAGGLHLLLSEKGADAASGKFRNFLPSTDKAGHNVWKIYQDQQNRYWLGAHGGGLFLMEVPPTASNKVKEQDWTPQFHNYTYREDDKYCLPHNAVYDIYQDVKGRFWFASLNGLSYTDEILYKEGIKKPVIQFQKQNHNVNDSYSISSNNVHAILEDEQGLLWFATLNGLSQYNYSTSQFNIHHFLSEEDPMPNTQNIAVDSFQNIWMAMGRNGLGRYSVEKNTIENISKQYPTLLLDNHVYAIYSQDNNQFFIGTKSGVTILDSKTFQVRKHPVPQWIKNTIPNFIIEKIFVDKVGIIWLATKNGLFTISPATGEYTLHLPRQGDNTSISDNAITDIFQDSRGSIWVATYKGLNRVISLNRKASVFKQFLYNPDKPKQSIPSNQVLSLAELDNRLYIGTLNGLHSYHLDTKQFESYSSSENNSLFLNIQSVQNKQLWLSSPNGIVSFDPIAKTFLNFKEADGVGDGIFRKSSGVIDLEGQVYFGMNKGFVSFQPDEITINSTAPPVYITGINKMNGDTTISINGTYLEEITLSPKDYYTSFNFVALNYQQAEKNKFSYQLEGLDDKWLPIVFGQPIIYTNLPPDTYTLRIKAANNDGVWNEKGTVLKIIKEPAFWQTIWFTAIIWLFGGLALIGGVYLYTTKIRNRNLLLQEYNTKLKKEIEERTRAEHALANREELLGIMMNTIPQYICIVDKQFKVMGVNSSFKKSIGVEDESKLIGIHIDSGPLPPSFLQQSKKSMKSVLATEKAIFNELYEIKGDKPSSSMWIEQNIIPLRGKDNNIFGMLVCGTDITTRKQHQQLSKTQTQQLQAYNKELERSNKELEQFAYIASHDLQSPLNTIISFSRLLEKSSINKLTKTEQEFLHYITSSTRNMQELVDAILQFSRINTQKLQRTSFSLTNLLAVLQVELNALLEENKATLKIGSMPEMLHSDRIKIKQLLQNLITNGIKFSKAEVLPLLVISCSEQSDYWQFQVQDNGIGISKEFNEKIFQLFQRLHTASEYKGTGIGLALCKKLVTQLGGDIWVESVLGEGSTFYFTVKKSTVDKRAKSEQLSYSLNEAATTG